MLFSACFSPLRDGDNLVRTLIVASGDPVVQLERIIGCDFGASLKPGEQARKTILIEALRTGERRYRVDADGRNRRICEMGVRRRGWTLAELVKSIGEDASVRAAAFDFPFSIPAALLRSAEFARAAGSEAFETRARWARFVEERVGADYASIAPELLGWKDKAFWIRRATDRATRAQPPLKHLFQNVFNMTIMGSKVLGGIARPGRSVIESYPGAVARAIGCKRSYKLFPEECLAIAEEYLARCGVELLLEESVREFCQTYRSAGNDPDGADAFLCLVTAICFREGLAHWHWGGGAEEDREEEGCIVTPRMEVADNKGEEGA